MTQEHKIELIKKISAPEKTRNIYVQAVGYNTEEVEWENLRKMCILYAIYDLL
ncbi:MAG: hypothetical protein HY363_03070 [Candidatus Aenigmarchaeota archaeon]|nr:hypothetical protein [Candidatus Aenigmarchaeota archaeon]